MWLIDQPAGQNRDVLMIIHRRITGGLSSLHRRHRITFSRAEICRFSNKTSFVGITESYSHIVNRLLSNLILQLFASSVRDRGHATIVATLLALQSNHLNHLRPETNWWVDEGLLVSIDDRTFPNQISLAGLDELGLLDNLPEDEEDWCEDQHGVVGEEALHAEAAPEGGVSVAENDEPHPCEGDVSSVGLEPTSVWEGLAVETLLLASVVEEDVGRGHDDVVYDSTGGDQVDQPCQNLGRTVAQLEERQEGEAHDDTEASKRNSALGAVSKECWSAAFNSKSIQRSGCAVGVGVAGRKDGGDQESVDKVRQAVDPEVLHGNDIRRCSTGTTASGLSSNDGRQGWVVVGDQNSDCQGSDDEKNTKSPVHGLEGSLNILPRTLCFSSDHANIFRAHDFTVVSRCLEHMGFCKSSYVPVNEADQSAAKKPSKRPSDPVLRCSAKAPGLLQ